MRIQLSNNATKQLDKLPKHEVKKVYRKLSLLENDPLIGKKLQGEFLQKYSLKAWPYRIIYLFDPIQKIIFIEDVEHRQGVYK